MSESTAGIDVAGIDVAGIDVAGIDVAGIDVAGIDVAGIDVAGIDVAGIDVAGIDVAGIDVAGIDVAGIDVAGIDVAGIDVGKRALDVSVDEGKVRRFANTAAGVGELVSWLRSQGAALAVCEASGGYEGLVVDGLRQGGVPVHIAHPNQVRE